MQKTMYGASLEVEQAKKKYEDVEKVLLDFGKQYTKLVSHEAEADSDELNFDGYKIYFLVPPNLYLEPSNVIIFELIWVSSQTSSKDYIMGWGAFPLVNGDFEINQGKFKLPILNGQVDYSSNKFKDIEKKYIRNVDEWLANLYIEVKTFELIGFQMHHEKVELRIPKEYERKTRVRKWKESERIRRKSTFLNEMLSTSNGSPKKLTSSEVMSGSPMHTQESEKSEGDRRDQDDDSDDGGNGFWSDEEDDQVYVSDKRIENYEEYSYSVQENRADLKRTYEAKDLSIRKL